MSLMKTIKNLVSQVNSQSQNYSGVQQLPTFPIGYNERIQYSEGGQSMKYKENKYTGSNLMMSKGSKVKYNKGGYASVQQMEQSCGSKTVKQKVK